MSMLKSQSDCKYLSITNADNVYGSEVVERVLHWTPSPGQLPPDMLLAPLDSRNFAEHGQLSAYRLCRVSQLLADPSSFCYFPSNAQTTTSGTRAS